MKKFFLFAALACTVFASCQKEASVAVVNQNDGQQEVTFAAFSKAMTKTVLGGGAFAETRTIKVAGVMRTADGQYVDFLEVRDFNKVDDYWKAQPAVYYPIGSGDFRFLAYSESSGDETFSRWYGSKEVELQVAECAENEIVYSGFQGQKNGVASAAFKRTQALVTVNIKAASGDDAYAQIRINKIGFKDVKTSGTLVLKIDPTLPAASADAKHEWLFTAGCNCAFAQMNGRKLASGDYNDQLTSDSEIVFDTVQASGDSDALGAKLTTTGFVLDRLFPAQKLETKTMVIEYTLGGITREVELDLSQTSSSSGSGNVQWAAGTRYVYVIKVNVTEIAIDPASPRVWDVKEYVGTYDPEY